MRFAKTSTGPDDVSRPARPDAVGVGRSVRRAVRVVDLIHGIDLEALDVDPQALHVG
jgi:hypothetical protein